MRRALFLGTGILILCAAAAFAQSVVPVELSIPFGAAPGKLVISPEYLIFIDEQQPEYSFVIHPQELEEMTVDTGMLTMHLKRPVRDRSGSSTRLSLRTQDKTGSDAVFSWWKNQPARALPYQAAPAAPVPQASQASQPVQAARPAESLEKGEEKRYRAEHDHRFGSCNGQLIITPDRIIYESVTDLDHSRQWTLRDIKEIKNDGPYQLEITPFTGGSYKLRLLGNGIDPADYRILIDRITKAREPR